MTRHVYALIVLVLATLACGQYITPTPEAIPPTSAATRQPTLSPTGTAVPSATAEADDTAVVRAAAVNVRNAPDGSEVVGQLVAGTDVLILEIDGDWAHIAEPDGWVFVGCLSISDGKGCLAK